MIALASVIALCLVGQSPHFTKRALLVGVWDYKSKQWPNLSSNHDVSLIKSTLETHFGWTPANGGKIEVLTSRAETTRKSIMDRFRSFLATDVREGDTIYFHYSGHGYQAPDTDPNKDPKLKIQAPVNPLIGNSPSGLDQTLLPTDDPDHNANQIRNDELGLLVKQILDAADGKRVNVLVTIDACHSGGGTRGIARIVRGKPYEGQTPKAVVAYDPKSPNAVFLSKVKGYTFLSACREDQEAGEAVGPDKLGYGRFTLALCDAFSKCSPSTTYRQLYDEVDETMSSRWTFGAVDAFSQNPQMEGEANRSVFGASAEPASSYMTLLPLGKGTYRLKGGALNGITQGSVLKLYSSSNASHVLATLTATKVGMVDSNFTSSPSLASIPPAQLSGAKAMLVSQGITDNGTVVDISAIRTSALFANIKDQIATRVPAAALSEQPDPAATLKIEAASGGSGFRIFRVATAAEVTADAFGKPEPIPSDSSAPDAIADRVFSELRYQAISRMANDFPGQGESVQIEAVPCQTTELADGKVVWVKDIPLGAAGWTVGTKFVLKYRVIGNWEPYIAVLDLTSDSNVSVLWPPDRYVESVQVKRPYANGKPDLSWQYLKAPNSEEVLPFKVTLPLGKEIMKMVASERPLPFGNLLGVSRGSVGKLTPLGSIFSQFSTVTKRSQAESTDPGEMWSTRQVVISVHGEK